MNKNKKYLDLKQIEDEQGFNPNTIKRERYEQKLVQSKKIKPDDVRNADGFGYTTEAYQYYGKLFYKRDDIENWIANHKLAAPKDAVNG